MKTHDSMRQRLEQARTRLQELESIPDPDDAQRGSMEYERERIAHLERMTTPER